MSTPTDRLPPFGTVDDVGRYGSVIGRREPPGEAFPPVNPLIGSAPIRSPQGMRPRDLIADLRTYVALIAQRTAPINEQVYQGSTTLLGPGTPVDVDLGSVPANLTARVHRLVVMGAAADSPSVSLYRDGFALGNALAGFSFAAGKLGVLDADGVGMAEPRELNLPPGGRIVARCRGVAGPLWLALFVRSYAG